MNKSVLKSFATEARRELHEKIQLQALKLGITPEAIQQATLESSDAIFIDGKQLSEIERKQRNKLIARINEIGYDEVIKEAAYTWFNRFIALRYMEVNDYLPTKVRVLSSVNLDSTEPDMFKEALNLDLPIDKELVYNLKIGNNTDELFEYLIKLHCNDLNRYMPFMFENVEGYLEILFPKSILGTDTFVRKMTDVESISEEDWTNVEIVGWLYQYYISDENERVIKAKKKYKKEEIPYATQLFTPEWIVRYMVQNALGRYWVESHPEHRELIGKWEFYLENPNPESDFEEKIAPYINRELNIEDIKCFDPAMGSGHILTYMFDVLYEIYIKCGYMEREIPRLIIEKNLYGLDIDNRAYQLASFSIVMKALQYNKRFLRNIEREGIVMNLASIQESNILTDEDIAYIAGESIGSEFNDVKEFINQFNDAKTVGSLIKLSQANQGFLEKRLEEIKFNLTDNLFEDAIKIKVMKLLPDLLKQYKIMYNQFDILVTNPPYIGRKFINNVLGTYLKKYYFRTKSDVFAAFLEYSFGMVKSNGHIGFMTPFVWMFISTYEKLRNIVINEKNISSLIQLEYSAFEEATVPICSFTLRNSFTKTSGEYIQLTEFPVAKNQPLKTLAAIENPNVNYRYTSNSEEFNRISGIPIAYWVSNNVREIFENTKPLFEVAKPKVGMFTSDNDRFLRFWHEVKINNIGFSFESREQAQESKLKWFPYNKGGAFRKWYGNNDYVVNWENDGQELKEWGEYLNKVSTPAGRLNNKEYYFKEGITWSDISSSNFGVRYTEKGFLFDISGSSVFPDKQDLYIMLGLLCSKLSFNFLRILNPTMHFQTGNISDIPYKEIKNKEQKERIESLVLDCIYKSKEEWDQFETSWNFTRHPLVKNNNSINLVKFAFENMEKLSEDRFNQVKNNEEQLNEIFIKLYCLENELTSDVNEKDITIRKSDLEKEIKSLISYAIGCTLGRYSLDGEGICYAGGEIDVSHYKTFPLDKDNILPILSGTYFEDDIVKKFVDFIRVTFAAETLEQNLDFIADALGRKKNETARETLRRYFITDFYKDHVQIYKKRPIYWLFTSGKEKAFNCLIYMHRYDKTTLSRIRTDYVHEVQNRMDAERTDLLNVINGDSTVKEIAAAKKELKLLEKN